MAFIDVILIVIISAFVFFGLFFGLIHTLGSLVGAVVGIFLSMRLVEPVFDVFGFALGGGDSGRVIMFIILFAIISRLVGVVFWVLEKIFGVFTIVPFAGTINRLLGAVFGLIEGVIVVGVVLFYAMQILPDQSLLSVLETSVVAKLLVVLVSALQVFFPESLQQLV